MTDEVAKFLYDMLVACQQISEFCTGYDEQSFMSDPVLVAAVERKLMIVGEALYGTRRYEPRWHELVSKADDIVRLRHVLVHH